MRIWHIISCVRDAFIDLFNYRVETGPNFPCEYEVLECVKQEEVSYHVHFHTRVAFENNFQLKYFGIYVKKLLELGKAAYKIDMAVYNRNQVFRLGWSAKTIERKEIFNLVRAPDDGVEGGGKIPIRRCLINAAVDTPVFPPIETNAIFIGATNFIYRSDADFDRLAILFEGRVFGRIGVFEMSNIVHDIKVFENSPRTYALVEDIYELHLINDSLQDDIRLRDGRYYGPSVSKIWGQLFSATDPRLDVERHLKGLCEKYSNYMTIVNDDGGSIRTQDINLRTEKRGQIYNESMYDGDVTITLIKQREVEYGMMFTSLSKEILCFICGVKNGDGTKEMEVRVGGVGNGPWYQHTGVYSLYRMDESICKLRLKFVRKIDATEKVREELKNLMAGSIGIKSHFKSVPVPVEGDDDDDDDGQLSDDDENDPDYDPAEDNRTWLASQGY